MRIWDISPGYLSRQSLLGEHRELHGLYAILTLGKQGYAHHPETVRWVGCVAALMRRHLMLAEEMRLRGYTDRTPLNTPSVSPLQWPACFIDSPQEQLQLLLAKYQGQSLGRIPFPRSAQELWAQHKYSVMARDQALYRSLGKAVARMRHGKEQDDLAATLVAILRQEATSGHVYNAIQHLWGYVAHDATALEQKAAESSSVIMFAQVQRLAMRLKVPYLLSSTALSDIAVLLSFLLRE